MKIENVRIYGLEESIVASGYPMLIEPYSEEQYKEEVFCASLIDSKQFDRGTRLGNTESNSGHSNYLTGITVQFDILYPSYWSNQFQRYHFIQIISSQSKMHKLAKFDLDKAFNKHVLIILTYIFHY